MLNKTYFFRGVGADHHAESAVYWYRQASDQGHAKSQYNLAISHLRGFDAGLQPGFVIVCHFFFFSTNLYFYFYFYF